MQLAASTMFRCIGVVEMCNRRGTSVDLAGGDERRCGQRFTPLHQIRQRVLLFPFWVVEVSGCSQPQASRDDAYETGDY